ncbi:hypothetical protein HNR48_003993 [Pseudoteredinibacter isoporae]|uniref:Uncharacterized protein n=1 Tax=Pseudoteredinibacter isoporae TaxID=570281 RepID=A0A7X0JXS6_9GAMM|nr:hypothetical protein [Pseudoteredinibacter isoporae]
MSDTDTFILVDIGAKDSGKPMASASTAPRKLKKVYDTKIVLTTDFSCYI